MSIGGAEARLTSGARKLRLLLQSGLCGVFVFGLSAGAASAQTAPASPPAAETKPDPKKDTKAPDKATTDANASGDTTTVMVTGQKPANLNRIDRQVYDNTKDPDSKTSSVADALNKVPGVSVDPAGNVTLRGKDPQILINGKPSPMLQGDNRAAALQAMPSGSVSSFEIMNNPGAQYGSGSGGPVINLVTNATLPPGGFLSLTGQASSTGSTTANMFGQYHAGKLSTTGVLALGDNKRESNNGSVSRQLDSSGNTVRRTDGNGHSENEAKSIFTNGSLEYAFNPKDSLTGQFNYTRFTQDNESVGNYAIYNTAGAATDIYKRTGTSNFASENQMVGLAWNHVGDKPGETLKIDARMARSLNKNSGPGLSTYSLSTIPANLAGRRSDFRGSTNNTNSTFSVDYNTPVGDDQLSAGIQITRDTSDARNMLFGPDPASATVLTPSPLGTNVFDYTQTVNAAYVTYQKPFGQHWTVLAGLRAEMFELDALALPSNLTNHVEYTTYNPSLFATYIISDKAKVRLSYSHRLQRPTARDYNPATVFYSEQSVSVGAPDLKPQETDSYEAGYEYSDKTTSYQLRGYYTRETGMIIQVSTFIADPLNLGNLVQRTGRLNAGTRDTVGTEFNFNGKFGPHWSTNLSANLSSVDFRTPNFTGAQSVTGLGGRMSVSYTTTSRNDSVSVSYMPSPKVLSGQGYRDAYSTAQISYSHKFTPTLSLNMSVTDMLRSGRFSSVTQTPTVYSLNTQSNQAPLFMIGLSRRFGGFTPPKGGGGLIIGGQPASAGAASPGGGSSGGGVVIRY